MSRLDRSNVLAVIELLPSSAGFSRKREVASFKLCYPNRVRESAASGMDLILTSYFFSGGDRGIPDIADQDLKARSEEFTGEIRQFFR